MSSNYPYLTSNHLQIFISNISVQTEPRTLLTYFEHFGNIDYYNFTSIDGGGVVFITYTNCESVDQCMASRPHRLDDRQLYVKRSLPFNSTYPRDHKDSCRDLMIIVDFENPNEQFLRDVRAYFSFYGTLYACKYRHENNFDYVLIEFIDYDQVDRIILDKPHYINGHRLNIAKFIAFNRNLLNIKYSSKPNENDSSLIISEQSSTTSSSRSFNDSISGMNKESQEMEIHRLRHVLKKISKDFDDQRQRLEDECCDQLRQINEDAGRSHPLQQDLEQEYSKLLTEYESLKQENEALNEQYLSAELENFEITSYYELILAEEKAKTTQYEVEYTQRLGRLSVDDPLLPVIPDDTDD